MDLPFARSAIPLAFYAAMAALTVALACGPFFSVQLLDDRSGTLAATPANSFAFEAQRLIPATDALKARETPVSPWEEPAPTVPSDAQGLTGTQAATVARMRAAPDGEAAFALGDGLPPAVRAYTAGAVDWHAADPWCGPREPAWTYAEDGKRPPPRTCDKDLSAPLAVAERRFGQVLSLYPESAAPRAVWAAYMLGQVHAVRAARAEADGRKEIEAAAQAFALARARAAKGDPDPDGLAVASYGEEARLYLSAHGCGWADFLNGSDCPAAIAPADLKRMIALYAQQASRGSAGGLSSLAAIAGWALRDGTRAAALIDDPVAQRLLVAYALPRAQASIQESDQGAGSSPLAALVRAADARGLDHVQDADRLAALAYGVGLYDVAGRFLATAQGPLAQWVNAKLQLRRGDMAGAALSYARAAKAFPQVPDGLSPGNNRLIKGEQGVLSLARGEYVEALSALYDAALAADADAEIAYDQDAFYIADRVLMTDELKRFVDARTPEPPALGPQDTRWSDARITVPLHLRWLLARRLMREDRRDEAMAYYPASLPPGVTDIDVRASARTYVGSLSRADSAWTDTGRARALYAAAVTARKAGMEILGYEQEPDYAAVQGVYGFGYGRPDDWCAVVTANPDGTVTRTPGPPTSSYTTRDECQRYNATMARPDYRYHYRYVAADLATRAANHLPRRSQAYAAVLCKAVGWTLTGQGDTARTLYRRYVAEGAYVPWATNFGRHCQEPDFGAARWFTARQAWKATRHWTRVNWYVPLAAAIGLAALGVALARRRRAV